LLVAFLGENFRAERTIGGRVEGRLLDIAVPEEGAALGDEEITAKEVDVGVGVDCGQVGIAGGVGRLCRLVAESLDGFEPAFGAPAAEADAGAAVDEDVVVHEVVVAAVDLDAAEEGIAASLEEIAVDDDSGDHVVEADARSAAMGAAADIAPAVPADHDAAIEGIAPHVDAALVVGLLDDLADGVQLDDVVVALDSHGRGWHALEEVVGDSVATAVEVDGGGVGAFEAGNIVDGGIFDEMAAGCEGLAAAAIDPGTAATERVHCAAEDAVAQAAFDEDRIAAQPADGTSGDQAIGAAADANAVGPPFLERQTDQQDVLGAVDRDEGLAEHAQDRLGLRRLDAFGREPVDHAGAAVEVPFARRVDLAEDIRRVVALVLAVAVVGVGRGQLKRPGVGVDGGDGLILLEPVPEPVAIEAHVGLVEPSARAVVDVPELAVPAPLDRAPDGEGVGAEDVACLDEAVVGPAGKRLGAAVGEQLGPAAESGGVAHVLESQRLQIGLQHAVANGRVELVPHGCVRDRLPSGDFHSAVKYRSLAGFGLIDHRGLGGTRILRSQCKRPLDGIRRAADKDADATLGERAAMRPLHRTHGVSCPLQCTKGPALGAIRLIASFWRDVERRGRLGQHRQLCTVGLRVARGQALCPTLRLHDAALCRVPEERRESLIGRQSPPCGNRFGRIIASQGGLRQAQMSQTANERRGRSILSDRLESLGSDIELSVCQCLRCGVQSRRTGRRRFTCGGSKGGNHDCHKAPYQ